jgi:hypothetical protein
MLSVFVACIFALGGATEDLDLDQSCSAAEKGGLALSDSAATTAKMLMGEGKMYMELEQWAEAENSYREIYKIYQSSISGFDPVLSDDFLHGFHNASANLASCCKNQQKFVNHDLWGLTNLDPKDVYFVQAGSNCGSDMCAVCGENIWSDSVAYGWNGTVIEAHPLVYQKLVENYIPNPSVVTINAAITSQNGLVKFYSAAKEQAASITSQISSLTKNHLHTGFADKTKDISLDEWQGRYMLL